MNNNGVGTVSLAISILLPEVKSGKELCTVRLHFSQVTAATAGCWR